MSSVLNYREDESLDTEDGAFVRCPFNIPGIAIDENQGTTDIQVPL